MTFNYKSLLVFICLFLTEVLIAKFVTQPFIRYWFGDFLVVIMIYYFVKTFIKAKPLYIAVFVLIFSFSIEFLQMSNLLEVMNLKNNKIANLILGNTFSVSDLFAYFLGIVSVLILELKLFNK
ncbi:MAG: DUF2809 domain-containing protein [Flavobacteriaceae bacterium]|nr:DUF2809 domain-containing protein [Flavobacteriaceae bacterium]